jgi:hypothetical protein
MPNDAPEKRLSLAVEHQLQSLDAAVAAYKQTCTATIGQAVVLPPLPPEIGELAAIVLRAMGACASNEAWSGDRIFQVEVAELSEKLQPAISDMVSVRVDNKGLAIVEPAIVAYEGGPPLLATLRKLQLRCPPS